MPPGRKKMIGPRLPKGGYRSLITKKRLADTAAYYAAASKKLLSGANRQRRRKVPMSVMTTLSTATTPKVKRTASPAQLAALAKARAARAAKKTGAVVAVAVAAPKAQGGAKRGRPKMIGPKLPVGGYKSLMKLNAANVGINTLPTLAYGEYF